MNVMRGLPVLAVCGWSGSGKTTLLEGLIPRLRALGLRVAVIKSDAHGIEVDRPGKDSDRLFRAGADVLVGSPNESFARWHGQGAPDLLEALHDLTVRNDIVLVEGHKATALKKIWLLGADGTNLPVGLEQVVGVLPRGPARLEAALDVVLGVLRTTWGARRILGGILIGGRSRRMGRAKQLLDHKGRTIVEGVVAALKDQVEEVVLLGDGEVPSELAALRRLPDPLDVEGPMAGMASGLRWAPDATWLMASCDLPLLTSKAVRWLLDQRQPGRWAILPRTAAGVVDPLLAVYEPQALPMIEQLVRAGSAAPRLIVDAATTFCPTPPETIADQWRGVNTPEEFREICGESGERRRS